MAHLILTGFMGSGKTTVGKILANDLDLPFVDLDETIEAQTGLAPQFYIPRFGEAAFRRIEKICLNEVLKKGPSVLAAGGGAVLDSQNRQRILSKGFVVWLAPPFSVLRERFYGMKNRPLLPGTFRQIRLLYRQRLPLYRQCHFQIDTASSSPKKIANCICKKYREVKVHGPRSMVHGPSLCTPIS
ncbi:MAG: shikimate kinase [Deltaproteobacteria bacterium]|nr:shikimate kinase [Deltaproteobacteria bacterium]